MNISVEAWLELMRIQKPNLYVFYRAAIAAGYNIKPR